MIVRQNKGYEINPMFPDTDWYEQNNYVVEDGSSLAQKIISLYPNFDFVLDASGKLTDVTAIDPPIDVAKQNKIAELNAACGQAILGKFSSTVNGTTFQFSNDSEAQSNFKDGLWALENNKLTTVKWTAYDANGNVVRIDLNLAELQNVNVDRLMHNQNNVSKFRDVKEAQVNDISVDTAGKVNAIVWNDTTPPSSPTGLTATAGTAQATLIWTANTEIDVQIGGGYNVYKGGTKINTSLVTSTSYTVTNLTSGTAVTFTITAVDSDGNESPQSASITVTPN